MKRILIREEGLVGTLFYKNTFKSLVICLGGFSSQLHEERAKFLAEHGFGALVLAYFAYENLPFELSQIPLEYFEKAIQLMRLKWGAIKVALWGGSRGAEAALILGAYFPDQIDAIAAHVPSSVVFGSLTHEGIAAWTFKKEPVAMSAPFKYTETTRGNCRETAISLTSYFLKAMEDKDAFEAAAIEVEKIRCPILLISAKDDQMWPSTLFANQIEARLIKHCSSIFCSHLCYERVGHAPSRGVVGFHPILKRWFIFGGTPEENAKAAVDWPKKTIHFFQKCLS